MKVRITKATAGAGGNIRPGTVIDVSDSEGKLLIGANYAEPIEERQPAKPAAPKKPRKPKELKKES